jgi:hypothetical protein
LEPSEVDEASCFAMITGPEMKEIADFEAA